ncbi:autotransporter-associated beta strand repeat-containing protein [Comamonas sp. C24C]
MNKLKARLDVPLPTIESLAARAVPKILGAIELVKNMFDANHSFSGYREARAAVDGNETATVLRLLYEKNVRPGWRCFGPPASEFTNYIASFTDINVIAAVIAQAQLTSLQIQRSMNQAIYDNYVPRQSYLTARTSVDANCVGSIVKTGSGSLALAGDNSYSGGTQLKEGMLGVGQPNALGTGVLTMSDMTIMQALIDGLSLRNDIRIRGIGSIDTQDFGLTLSGNIRDDVPTSGGLVKLGAGMLTISGVNTYSGPTQVMSGTLQAGSARSFSPNSAFFINSGARLDLGGFDQTIGSLTGDGVISQGNAKLTTVG